MLVPGLDEGTCKLCIGVASDYNIFGMTLLRGYYAIHDMETTPKRMGFVPQAGSTTAPVVQADTVPTNPLPTSDLYTTSTILDVLGITP